MSSTRRSFTAKVLLGGVALAVILVTSTSGFLLLTQDRATQTLALREAGSQVTAARQHLIDVTGGQTMAQAANTFTFFVAVFGADPNGKHPEYLVPAINAYLESSDGGYNNIVAPAGASACLAKPSVSLNYDRVVMDAGLQRLAGFAMFDSTGNLVCADVPAGSELPAPTASARVVKTALAGKPSQGVDMISSHAGPVPEYDVAVPLHQYDNSLPVGALEYSAPLGLQLRSATAQSTYLYDFISGDCINQSRGCETGSVSFGIENGHVADRFGAAPSTLALPLSALKEGDVHAEVNAGSGTADAYTPLCLPRVHITDSCSFAGYLGVHVPLSAFAASQSRDKLLLVWIAATALALSSLAIVLSVDRFVGRPVRRLDQGVARIAGGDYTTDVPVTSEDELGRLATGVNTMRGRIAEYIGHLDASVTQLSEVAQALTTTTSGLPELRQAVLGAACAIVGKGASAAVLNRSSGRFTVAEHSAGTVPALSDASRSQLEAGQAAREESAGVHLTAIPMLYRGETVGGLIVRSDTSLSDTDLRALTVLASNAAVALQNAQLFEMERETVQKLRELDSLKSDFLSTTRHELRTPLTAILGQLEVMKVAWDQWAEETKLDFLNDIEISTKLMDEIVETMLDFSLLSGNVPLRLQPTPVAEAVAGAITDVESHFKAGLPVSLDVAIADNLIIQADAKRFRQVIRTVLDNSVKFADKGHVWISAKKERDKAIITIKDDGIGISGEALSHVYEPFYQEDPSQTRRYGGLGMGLALVKRLVDAHHAEIRISSVQDEGTAVELRWPLGTGEVPIHKDDTFHVTDTGVN